MEFIEPDKDAVAEFADSYPGPEAFLRMVSSPEYQKIAIHRGAAPEDSRLIAHREL